MKRTGTILITALAIVVFAGAVQPVNAFDQQLLDLCRTWQGSGAGSCTISGVTMDPYESWIGDLCLNEDDSTLYIEGTWSDGSGTNGHFGSWDYDYDSEEGTVIFTGAWSFYNPSSCYGGPFELNFQLGSENCEGSWENGSDSTETGVIEGH